MNTSKKAMLNRSIEKERAMRIEELNRVAKALKATGDQRSINLAKKLMKSQVIIRPKRITR